MRDKYVAVRGARPRERLQDYGFSIAVMAESITHPAESTFSHAGSISRVGGVNCSPLAMGTVDFGDDSNIQCC